MVSMHDKSFSLQEAQDLFAAIYGERNVQRFGLGPLKGISSLWLEVIRHTSEVARAIRRGDNRLLLDEIPKVFCWFCGLCTKIGVRLDDVIWHFFPWICPTCYCERCQCGIGRESDGGIK